MTDAFGRKDAYGRKTEGTSFDELLNPKKESRKNAYQKHFEDYVTRRVLKPDGKTVTERIYVGVYYRQAVSDGRWKSLKAMYLLLSVLTAVLFGLESLRDLPSNSMKPVAVFQLAGIVLILRLFFTVLVYITAPRRLTIGELKSSILPLKNAAFQTAAGLILLSASVLTALCFDQDLLELTGVLLYAAAAGAAYLLYRTESGIQVVTEENSQEALVNMESVTRV